MGLCFNCDEKFTAGHKCRGPQLLLLGAPAETSSFKCEEVTDEQHVEGEPETEPEPKISLHALTGWSSPKTMRVAAKIGSLEVVALIDCGSNHNFISDRVARLLRLSVVPTDPFKVRVANGEKLSCQGRFEQVPVNLQGIPFLLTLYALPIEGLDLVLGFQWLEMLGSVTCNWKQLTMEFQWENTPRKLQGLDHHSIQKASLKELSKEFRQGHSLFAICVHSLVDVAQEDMQPAMHKLLEQYVDVLAEPTQVPPAREVNHFIPLKEGMEPINVRPYRYAYFQKEEIENQVQEMLKQGIIRPSTSPFSSSVLLVKKKDGSWRFYTDYRALNAVTIKDCFPILTIEDMLDELHGATYFTKVDLRAGYHQIRVHSQDIPKTAFRTHNGHYEYLVMPFGLCNAPSTFQATMNSIFRSYLRKYILVFFDDILIYSPTWETDLQHVKTALEVLRKHQFFIKAKKMCFWPARTRIFGAYFYSKRGEG